MAWLSGFSYGKQFTIIGSTAGPQTNYQMKLTVHKGNGTDSSSDVYLSGHCKDDFSDIRFTISDGETKLDYWIEEYTSGDNATVWIEFDSIPASPDSATFYLYYGNSKATSESSGENTFPAFQGSLVYDGTQIIGDHPFASNYAVEAKARVVSRGEGFAFLTFGGAHFEESSEEERELVVFFFQDELSARALYTTAGARDPDNLLFDYTPIDTGVWYKVLLKSLPDIVRGFVDGQEIEEGHEAPYIGRELQLVLEASNAVGEVEYAFMRPYVSPEPTWGTWVQWLMIETKFNRGFN